MRYHVFISWITLATLAWPLAALAQSTSGPSATQPPQHPDDLSAKATDPTAALMSFGFINDFHTSFHVNPLLVETDTAAFPAASA